MCLSHLDIKVILHLTAAALIILMRYSEGNFFEMVIASVKEVVVKELLEWLVSEFYLFSLKLLVDFSAVYCKRRGLFSAGWL
jgi:hypothetical protein